MALDLHELEPAGGNRECARAGPGRIWSGVWLALLASILADGALILGGRAGIFGGGAGIATREFVFCAAVAGFLWASGRSVRRIDRERRRATDSLRVAHDSLRVWIGEQGRIEAELRESERLYRFLADAVPQMLWTARADGGTDYFNQRWVDYSGLTLEQSREWGWLPVIHPDDADRCTRVWTEAFESGHRYEIEYRLRRVDGEYRWQLGRADPMRDEDGHIVRWFGTCTDIDDQKRVEAQLRAVQEGLSERISERTAALEAANQALVAEVAERRLAVEAAQAASRAKGEFLANMSHEIRTPMNGILGMIELALRTTLTPTQRDYLGVVATSADALLTVINDILDFSKIEAGKLELDPIPFLVRDTVTDTLRSLALRAHDKGLELACRIAPDVPRSVVGDPGRLRQVLVNLIGNALKFTERGEVIVGVELDAPGPGPTSVRLRFSVADTGIGIPQSKRGAIFVPFEQADGSTTRRYGGTGLGLSISAKLVGLMGGSIAIEDNPGGGTRFDFEAQFQADPTTPGDLLGLDPDALDGLRVLVVDDNATNRRILREVLAQWGCRPGAVAGGVEALEELGRARDRDEPYAVVLLDMMMPGMDGLDLAARLRAQDLDPTAGPGRLKLVMLTSAGWENPDRGDARALDGWLAKPVRQSELLDLLLDLMPKVVGPPAGSSSRPIAPAAPALAGRPLQILLAEDHPINQRVATRMIEDLGHGVVVVGDGRLAVETATAGAFDLILMDVQMPEMDGFEALAAIRGRELLDCEAAEWRGLPGPRPIPIIALTAHAMTGDRERCLSAGFDDYLSKPVQATRLREALDRFRPRNSPDPTWGPALPPLATGFDRRAAVANMGGDENLLDEVIRLFLDSAPHLLEQVRGAADRGDHPDLGRLAHTVAGVASNFGPNRLIDAARKLERAVAGPASPGEVEVAIGQLGRTFAQLQVALLAEVAACPQESNSR